MTAVPGRHRHPFLWSARVYDYDPTRVQRAGRHRKA